MILGVITLASVGVLLVWDARPALFPANAHDFLGAFPLATIAFAYVLFRSAHRPSPIESVKAILLAAAFLFWAANQFWPNLAHATIFNDIAIALFVVDVFLVMVGWPAASPDESFGGGSSCNCGCVSGRTKAIGARDIPSATVCCRR